MACESEQAAVDAAWATYQDAVRLEDEDPSPANFKNEREKYKAWDAAQKALSSCKIANAEAPLTNVAPCLMNIGEWTYNFVVDPDGRILYTKWQLGGGGLGWQEIPGGARTNVAASAAAVQSRNYIFIVIKDRDSGRILLNQCEQPNPQNAENWVGWQ